MDEISRDLSLDVLEHGEALFVLDRGFRILLVNRNFERLTSSRRENILGRTLWDAFPEAAEPAGRFWIEFHLSMRDRMPVSFEEYFDPLKMWTGVNVYPMRQGGLVAYFRDITGRKRIEEEMNRSRGQLEAVFQAMRDGVVVFDMQGQAILVNNAEAVMNGYPNAEAMKRNLDYFASVYELAKPDGAILPTDQWPVSRVLRGESLNEVQLCGRRRDTGQEWFFTFSGEPVRDEHGQQVLAVIITRDITAQKRDEYERDRLLHALQDSDRRKNEFLAMLSHELRNPLAPIRNSVHLLDRVGSSDPKAVRARAIIHRQVAHMARLIDDLLDITRISQGRIQVRREKLDFSALVAAAVEDQRDAFDATGVELTLRAPGPALHVAGDAVRLAQMLGNLLQNARKFTPRGGSVTVTLTHKGNDALLTVRDTGMGIPAELLPRLFQPFEQASTTLDRAGGGLGLGLALVKAVVELHDGSAAIRSEGPGHGTEVTLRLPAKPLPAQDAAPGPAEAAAAPAHPTLRVLIIEDNVDAAETLRDVLELTGGHQVEVANTGDQGIIKAHEMHPDVVLCDIGLPGMDGYQVAGHLRADPEVRGAKLIALSGYAAPEDVARAKDAGFDMHLAKPPSIDALTRAIE